MKIAIFFLVLLVCVQVFLEGSWVMPGEVGQITRKQALKHADLPLKQKVKGFKTRKVKKFMTKRSKRTMPNKN